MSWTSSTKTTIRARTVMETRTTILVGKSSPGDLGFLIHKSMRVPNTKAVIIPMIGPALKQLKSIFFRMGPIIKENISYVSVDIPIVRPRSTDGPGSNNQKSMKNRRKA